MAKKEEAPNMVERFAEFKEVKNIDKPTMIFTSLKNRSATFWQKIWAPMKTSTSS